jgi:hypothetical protein
MVDFSACDDSPLFFYDEKTRRLHDVRVSSGTLWAKSAKKSMKRKK